MLRWLYHRRNDLSSLESFKGDISEEISSLILLAYPEYYDRYEWTITFKNNPNRIQRSNSTCWLGYYSLFQHNIDLKSFRSFIRFQKYTNKQILCFGYYKKLYITTFEVRCYETSSNNPVRFIWEFIIGEDKIISSSPSPFIIPEKILKELI